jgi:hypothetical protein
MLGERKREVNKSLIFKGKRNWKMFENRHKKEDLGRKLWKELRNSNLSDFV